LHSRLLFTIIDKKIEASCGSQWNILVLKNNYLMEIIAELQKKHLKHFGTQAKFYNL
jgi:hypothetical protein